MLLGNGDGTFQPVVAYDSGAPGAWSVTVADVNGDGKPDLVVGNFDGFESVMSILLGNGDGTFQGANACCWDANGLSAAAADFNGDGILDLVSAVPCLGTCIVDGSVAVQLGEGNGAFQWGLQYDSGGWRPMSVAVADVNGDGKPDLVVANAGSNTVGVLLGKGDGTFQSVVAYGSGGKEGDGTSSVVLADMNGDGKLDVVVANRSPSGGGSGGLVGVLLGKGDGTFQPVVTYGSGGNGADSVVVADVNRDGRPGLVVANYDDGTVGVLLRTGTTPTTTTLGSSLNPSTFGRVVTFTAVVSAASGTPTGTVIFYDGSSQIGSATLANGSASNATSTLTAGSHSITAAYQGSVEFAASTSLLKQVVNPATATTSLASSVNPVPIKEYVTYTATVTSQYSGAVSGTVAFQDGGVTIATVTLSGSRAAYSPNYIKVGTHSITATYSGDSNNAGSVSPPLIEQVIKGLATHTVVTTSGSPSQRGQQVTLTATVTPKKGVIQDGELVTFYNGKNMLGSVALVSERAAYITSALPAGNHVIKAVYPGDGTFEPSSGSVRQVVEK